MAEKELLSLHTRGKEITTISSEPSQCQSCAILAGAAAGGVGVLVGQPFDTLKVRMQISSHNHVHPASKLTGLKAIISTYRYYLHSLVEIGSQFFRSVHQASCVRVCVPSLGPLYGRQFIQGGKMIQENTKYAPVRVGRGIVPPMTTSGLVSSLNFGGFEFVSRHDVLAWFEKALGLKRTRHKQQVA
jgi:hypothetical protein